MCFKIVEFDFKIGDAGVSQSDDGSGGTWVSVSGTITPEFGQTIISIAETLTLGGVSTPGQVSVTPLSNASVWTPNWSVSANWDAVGATYPLASGSTMVSVLAVVAY